MEKIDTPYPLLKSKEYALEEKVQSRSFVQTCKETSRRGLSAEQEVLKNDLFHIKLPFPWKLHELLDHVERDSNEHIISWLSCGRAFEIHKPDEFCDSIMTNYFRQTKFKSFTRQLYIYGFSKIEGGGHAFSHPEFVKGNRSICLLLGRNRFGDRRLNKSRKQTPTPMTEESKRPRNALMSSIQVLDRSSEAAGSLKAESRNCPVPSGSALSASKERIAKTGRTTANSASTSNPGLEGSRDVVAISRVCADGNGTTLPADTYGPDIDIPLREPYVSRSAHGVGNRTTLFEETPTSDWVTMLERTFFLFQNPSHPPLPGVMSTDTSFWNDLEPRTIENMNED